MRHFFSNRLPTCGTLRRWLRCVDASPGISHCALDEIAVMAREYREKGKKLFLCLISDEMHMRKQVIWNVETKSFHGFPTDPSTNSKDKLPVAKEVLVYMVAGEDFKMTVAYFFIDGLNAIDRAALTKEIITAIDNTGAKVISITNDGLRANIAVVKMLGADLLNEKTYFPRPNRPEEKIYVILDPSHMLKLVRGYFAYHQLYYKNDKLKWDLVELLVEKQNMDNFELANKLSRSHIKFKAPMNVSLAVQTISNSTADAIEQLSEDGYEDFIGSESTVKFMRLQNDVYDTMNYANDKPTDNLFKKPLCGSNIDDIRELYETHKKFINHITVEDPKTLRKKPILKSRINTGFLGFLTNMKSTVGIFTDYVDNGPLEMFQAFQYSQDHIETYFSLVRGSLGWNNNPNEIQFKSAYRKLLVCMPYLSARKTNCILSSTDGFFINAPVIK